MAVTDEGVRRPGREARAGVGPGQTRQPGAEDRATTAARVPSRSSPAPANPVTSQPSGSGHGSQTGSTASRSNPFSPSGTGR
jgi:hypothetical protein